jgi:hypothetical protein
MSNSYDCGGLGCGTQPCCCEPAERFVYAPGVIEQYKDLFCKPAHVAATWSADVIAFAPGALIEIQAWRESEHREAPMMRDCGFICMVCGNDRLSGDGDMREHCPSCGGKTKAMQIVDGRQVKGFL